MVSVGPSLCGCGAEHMARHVARREIRTRAGDPFEATAPTRGEKSPVIQKPACPTLFRNTASQVRLHPSKGGMSLLLPGERCHALLLG